MNFSLKLVDNITSINQKILKVIASKLNTTIRKALKGIESDIKPILISELKNQKEYGSLISGKLKYDFGISNPGSVDKVVSALAENAVTNFTPVSVAGGKLNGGFSIGFMKSDDMSGLIYTDIASVAAEGQVLPWLEWLLYQGTSPIIKKYQVQYGPNRNSRTGNAIMVESSSDWSVPSSFSGRATDNWTTRAVAQISDSDISAVVQKNIERYL